MIMEETQQTTTKLQLVTTDEIWNKVLKYKIERGFKNNNQAVEELISKSLQPMTDHQEIVTETQIPFDTLEKIKEFRSTIPIYEKKILLPLLILKDEKSETFYTQCHIFAEDFIKLSDPDATIDPELEEISRANRELETENFYFEQMVEDAKQGRQFSDLVIEFNKGYKETKPLKILGGQHRNEAIIEALKDKVNTIHEIKVYFNLDKEQREEIMRIANTNINVAPDLRDRLREEVLPPLLKKFGEETEMIKKGGNFGDKRRYDEDFSPTVRMIRSFIVNFFHGKEHKGNIDNDAEIPYLCKSGKDIDSEYLKIFNKFKNHGSFNDTELLQAGKMFAKLHDKQFKNVENIKNIASSAKREYRIKSFSLAIVASWAFASGALQQYPDRLKKIYSLPDLAGNDDPLNAVAMTKAKHKGLDTESYRGLGVRSDEKERGRLLQLFLEYSKSQKPKITEPMCNASIEIFHSNSDRKRAEESRKKAFEL